MASAGVDSIIIGLGDALGVTFPWFLLAHNSAIRFRSATEVAVFAAGLKKVNE